MGFHHKLSFLMDLTNTKNRQLAALIKVDPSLISRLRCGKRKIPDNSEYTQIMSKYFAERCTDQACRNALSRAFSNPDIKIMSEDEIASTVEIWLRDDDSDNSDSLSLQTNKFLKSCENVTLPINEEAGVQNNPKIFTQNKSKQIYTFYGTQGKQQATLFLNEIILNHDGPVEVKVSTEGNTDWLWKDEAVSRKISSNIKKAVLKGCKITEIIPRNQDVSMSFSSVRRWLVPYMVGKINAYYYPNLRDKVFNRTIYVAPGVAALESTTVNNNDAGLTIVTTDSEMVKALDDEFMDFLALCKPATTIHYHDPYNSLTLSCITDFFEHQSEFISVAGGLSFITSPREVFEDNETQCEENAIQNLKKSYEYRLSATKRILENHSYTEIITLAAVDDIVVGNVFFPMRSFMNTDNSTYTPYTYSLHLKNIIAMLEKYPNYNVVLMDYKEYNSTIYIKEDYGVLIFSHSAPQILTDIQYRDMVTAIWEYSGNLIENMTSNYKYKGKVIEKLKRLVLQLDEHIN